MHDTILVLVGTQTGNSERVAEDVAEALARAGHTVQLVDMADAVPELLEEYTRLIVVLCTWADGTFPDNAIPFWEQLDELAPDLRHLAYGVIALGDRLYEPYYQVAASRLAERLDALGATRAADYFEIDGRPRPKDLRGAERWAIRCAEAFGRVAA